MRTNICDGQLFLWEVCLAYEYTKKRAREDGRHVGGGEVKMRLSSRP